MGLVSSNGHWPRPPPAAPCYNLFGREEQPFPLHNEGSHSITIEMAAAACFCGKARQCAKLGLCPQNCARLKREWRNVGDWKTQRPCSLWKSQACPQSRSRWLGQQGGSGCCSRSKPYQRHEAWARRGDLCFWGSCNATSCASYISAKH